MFSLSNKSHITIISIHPVTNFARRCTGSLARSNSSHH